MPPAPRSITKEEVFDAVDDDANIATTDEDQKAFEPANASRYASASEWISALTIAGCLIFALYRYQFYEGPSFWFSVVAVALVLEGYSPAVHNTLQYVFPVIWAFYYSSPSYLQVALLTPTYLFLIGVPMSVCLHRYFAHQAFQTSRVVRTVLAVVSTFAYQGGALWWSAKHTRHHHFCDQPKDPHSVVQQGFFYAFCGWTVNPISMKQRDESYNHESLKEAPELVFLDRCYHVPPAILFTVLEAYYGVSRGDIVFSLLLPMLVCRLVTLFFNVEFHPAETEGRCKSINMSQFLAILVGEAAHETHHRIPSQCCRGPLDIPYYLTIYWMEAVGLVWKCR